MAPDLFTYTSDATPADTRLAALESIEPRADDLRDRVLRYMRKLASSGGKGITADECANALRLGILSIRPRFTELKKAGLICDTGVRRKNASGNSARVMTVTPLGMAQ